MSQRKEYLHEDKVATFLDRRLWQRLALLVRHHKVLAAVSFVLLVASEILPLFEPRVLKGMIDGPLKAKDIHGITPFLLAFCGLVLGAGILSYFRTLASQKLGADIIHGLRRDLFRKVQTYHMDFFHRTPVGRLMTRLGNDIDSLNTMFTEGLIELLAALLMILFAIVFMLVMDWRLALVTLSILPFMVLATSIFRVNVRRSNTLIRKLVAELNARLQESLAGVHIVRLFRKAREMEAAVDAVNRRTREAWMDNVRYYALYFPTLNSLTELCLVLLYALGAYLFYGDQVSLGTLIAFSWYTGMFFRPLREISDKVTALQSALSASERVFTLFDAEATLPPGKIRALPKPFRLRFEGVHFSYNPEKSVLEDIDFELQEGHSLAIVGATGSGKSTLISLCSHFYNPTKGRILLGDTDMREFDDQVLRTRMALIPQDVHLFAESVAFNVALSPNFDLNRVEEVCRHVKAHGFIEKLAQGYLTPLRQRGENLSVGQRQLLALARALYQQPQLLLLDEATASVDTETEQLIQEALGLILKEVTTIVVAHRLSTIKNADRILVMHKGRIRERGNHQELLAQGGIYQKLYQLQSFDGVGS